MQLIVNIDKKVYREVKDRSVPEGYNASDCFDAIWNGVQLPEGHGRLIDADELKKIIQANDVLSMTGFNVRLCDINNTPTIIEADKAESEGI